MSYSKIEGMYTNASFLLGRQRKRHDLNLRNHNVSKHDLSVSSVLLQSAYQHKDSALNMIREVSVKHLMHLGEITLAYLGKHVTNASLSYHLNGAFRVIARGFVARITLAATRHENDSGFLLAPCYSHFHPSFTTYATHCMP